MPGLNTRVHTASSRNVRHATATVSAFALALFSLAGAPAEASDFSSLAEPSFARSMLIDGARQRQVECAGLGLYLADRGKFPGKTAARRLANAVGRRLAIEVDDAAYAKKMVEGRGAYYADPTKTARFWIDARNYMTSKCVPYFTASVRGESPLLRALGPMPTKPLSLPSEEQCLAAVEYGEETKLVDWDADFGEVLRKERFSNVDPKESAKRRALVDGGVMVLRKEGLDKNRLELMLVACMHTVAEAAKRMGPDISDQLER